MMHWRAEPVPSPTPARSRGPMRPEATGRPLMVRALGLAIAALLTANFVIVAEQASGRDLITLGHDGLSNAREAIAKLLEDNKDKGQEPQVLWNTATPGYFDTIGIPFIRGRLFDSRDQLNTPVVFVINQTMARRFWPDQDPIGKPLKMAGEGTTGTVIGIVGDARQYYLSEEQQPQVYDCYSQFPGLFATVVARTSVEPMSLAQAARDAVWKVDKDQPVWKVRSEEFLLTRNVADKRFLMLLMGIFAALALTITAIGLYGVVSYTVGQRTQEIGIRMALGARTRDILAMILRQGMRMVLIGLVVGLAAAFALTRLMASLLYGTSASDPLAFAAIALLLAGVALVACFVPARRATRVDPMVALRYE